MSENLKPEVDTLAASIVAALVTTEIAKLRADNLSGDALIDGLTAVLPALVTNASAARVAAEHIAAESHPMTVTKRATAAKAARAASEEKARVRGREIERRIEVRKAQEVVTEARDRLAQSQGELARMERDPSSAPRDVVLAEGSATLWGGRLQRAEEALAALVTPEGSR